MDKCTYAEFVATLDPELSGPARQAKLNEWYDAMGLRRGVYCPVEEPIEEPIVVESESADEVESAPKKKGGK